MKNIILTVSHIANVLDHGGFSKHANLLDNFLLKIAADGDRFSGIEIDDPDVTDEKLQKDETGSRFSGIDVGDDVSTPIETPQEPDSRFSGIEVDASDYTIDLPESPSYRFSGLETEEGIGRVNKRVDITPGFALLEVDEEQYDVVSFANGDKLWLKKGTKIKHRISAPAFISGTGTKAWYENDKLNRFGAPAVEYDNGDKVYYRNGLIDNDDGPAVVCTEGTVLYYMDGMLGRDPRIGPAVILNNGTKEYWVDGKKHNPDGPATILPDGGLEYWFDGEKHRDDGPAVIYPNGLEIYYIHGKKVKTVFNRKKEVLPNANQQTIKLPKR